MNKLKEIILNEATKGKSSDTSNASSNAVDSSTSASTSAAGAITRFSDTYIDVIGGIVLAIDVLVYFLHTSRDLFPTLNNKQVTKKQ